MGRLLDKQEFKDLMKKYFDCTDIQVHISDNGLISFQGTIKTKKEEDSE